MLYKAIRSHTLVLIYLGISRCLKRTSTGLNIWYTYGKVQTSTSAWKCRINIWKKHSSKVFVSKSFALEKSPEAIFFFIKNEIQTMFFWRYCKILRKTIFKSCWNIFLIHLQIFQRFLFPLTYFSPVSHYIKKTLVWFIFQIKRIVSLWNTKLSWNDRTILLIFNPLSVNPTKWSNTIKQFVGRRWQIVWVCLIILWGWLLKG